ncbi:MAG: DUF3325 domain-containing protein [Stagnimonas sp.]|nr:DUF3325 domain-containing protein [Stagnimonas sp.]
MLEGGAAALLLFAAIVANGVGMAWVALSMDVHWQQVQGTAPSRGAVRRLRVLGALGLACGLAACLRVDHASMAVLVWIMALSAAALVVTCTLTWRPGWLKALAWLAGCEARP